MPKTKPDQLQSISKREFLGAVSTIGGASAVLTALEGWGIGFASAAEAPPDLMGSAGDTRVVILGGGLAGLTAAYELGLRAVSYTHLTLPTKA